MGYIGLVFSSGWDGSTTHKPRDCFMDVKLYCQAASVFLVELACSILCSSGLLLPDPLSICKPNWAYWSLVLCISGYACSSRCSSCAFSTCFGVQHRFVWG